MNKEYEYEACLNADFLFFINCKRKKRLLFLFFNTVAHIRTSLVKRNVNMVYLKLSNVKMGPI